ncbi:A/G-specific adenine glycosylase [Methyloversatilis sp.]|uniref:A/G-specific adenine glycosylase n=1 Tax=Methyloversatilis sp. TaxID=2569862 RepID=UPI0035B2F332
MNIPRGPTTTEPFATTLVTWQRVHGRHDLPWQTGEAYGVWVSEIMLQQTQVQTVVAYYVRFMQRFPCLASLAEADESAVMESWSGLGYYARARNLHRAARDVMTRFNGVFPNTVDDIESLPGIGRSTASAIATFCFGARAPILDGNVKRVFARVFGIDGFPGTRAVEQRMWALAHTLMPECDAPIYTQALMDLGATVCVRHRPRCTCCPVAERCIARIEDRQRDLPAPRPPRVRPLRLRHALLLQTADAVLLERRPGHGIWGGLLSLPELCAQTADAAQDEAAQWLAARGLPCEDVDMLPVVTHGFTHFELRLTPLRVRLSARHDFAAESTLHWLSFTELASAALPAPVRRLLASLDD